MKRKTKVWLYFMDNLKVKVTHSESEYIETLIKWVVITI